MPEETKLALARHPRPLSAEYHKARKQLMLWSAILFIWELIGIDLDTAKDEPGNVGAIVKSLKSRQAVPWVLLILVVYFLFKCSIEWAQCVPDRRRVVVSRIDFFSAWFVALAATVLYFAQTFSQVQVADFFGSADRGLSLEEGFAFILTLVLGIQIFRQSRKLPNGRGLGIFAILFCTSVAGLILFLLFLLRTNWTWVIVGMMPGIPLFTVTQIAFRLPRLRVFSFLRNLPKKS